MGIGLKAQPKGSVSVRRKIDMYGNEVFAVFIGASKRTKWFSNPKGAEALLADIKKNYRTCLCCRGHFLSEGAHNRMCDKCRKFGEGLT